MRLVAGSAGGADRTSLRAGIELRLATGWKTYWRYPGDSGVPPRFDFSKSTNVKSVTVRWPAPHRFTRRERRVDRLQGRRAAAAATSCRRTRGSRSTLRANARLRDLREALRARRGPADARARRERPPSTPRSPPRRRGCPSRRRSATARRWRSAASSASRERRTPASSSRSPHRSGAARSVRRRADRGMGAAAARADAGNRARSHGVIRSSSTACRPGATAAGATLRFTLVSGDKAIEVDDGSRLIVSATPSPFQQR